MEIYFEREYVVRARRAVSSRFVCSADVKSATVALGSSDLIVK